MTRYGWVLDRKTEGFPITMACEIAHVSRQAFNDWRAKRAGGLTDTELAEAALVTAMREIQADFDGTHGELRMTPELRAAKAGSISPRCSISARDVGSATRWPLTCAPNSSLTHSTWPLAPAAAR